jgi:hypothetical protein
MEVEPRRLFSRNARRSCYFVEPFLIPGSQTLMGLNGVRADADSGTDPLEIGITVVEMDIDVAR